jgi:exodeoxyribonuclease VII large subunit
VPLQRRRGELDRAIELALSRRVAWLSAVEARLATLSPAATLARGYAIVTAHDGRAVTSVADVSPGDAFAVQLEDGRIRAEATEISEQRREQDS